LEKEIGQAMLSYQSRDFAAARASLAQAKQREPLLPSADIMLARFHFLANRAPNGRAMLEAVVINQPDDPEPYLKFAEEALAAGRLTDADLLYKKAVTVIKAFNSNEKRRGNFKIRTLAGLAGIAEKRLQWSDAVKHLQAWLKETPDNPVAHARLGVSLFMSRSGDDDAQLQRTFKAFEEAQRNNSNLPSANVMISQLYKNLYDRDRNEDYRTLADVYMKRAIEGDGGALSTLVSAARWAIDEDQLDEADSYLSQARLREPTNHSAGVLSGVMARMANDHKAAEEYLLAAQKAQPEDWTTINQLTLALVDQGDDQKNRLALSFATQSAQQNSTNVNAIATLGWIYYQMNDLTKANQLFSNTVKMGGSLNSDTRYFLATVLFDKGQFPAAEQQLNVALAGPRLFVYRPKAQALLDKIAAMPETTPAQN